MTRTASDYRRHPRASPRSGACPSRLARDAGGDQQFSLKRRTLVQRLTSLLQDADSALGPRRRGHPRNHADGSTTRVYERRRPAPTVIARTLCSDERKRSAQLERAHPVAEWRDAAGSNPARDPQNEMADQQNGSAKASTETGIESDDQPAAKCDGCGWVLTRDRLDDLALLSRYGDAEHEEIARRETEVHENACPDYGEVTTNV